MRVGGTQLKWKQAKNSTDNDFGADHINEKTFFMKIGGKLWVGREEEKERKKERKEKKEEAFISVLLTLSVCAFFVVECHLVEKLKRKK